MNKKEWIQGFLKGSESLVVSGKTPALCADCYQKMEYMGDIDVGVAPALDQDQISVILQQVGEYWQYRSAIAKEAKAKCDICDGPAEWLFDHLNDDFLPAFKKMGITTGTYYFVNNVETYILDWADLCSSELVKSDHHGTVWVANHRKVA